MSEDLFTVRVMKTDDVKAVTEILRCSENMLWQPSVRSHEVYQYALLHGDVVSYVMVVNEVIVGVVFVECGKDYLLGTCTLQIAISPAYRHQGYGSKLLRIMVKEKLITYKRIGLHVTMDNIAAITMYLKCGFKFESVERKGYRGEDQYVMSFIR